MVTANPELLAQQISYADDDHDDADSADTIITGKGIEADTMESLLNAPNNIDIWKTLRKTIAQHNDKEKGRHPLNFIYCLIDELKKRGIINDEVYDNMNRGVCKKCLLDYMQIWIKYVVAVSGLLLHVKWLDQHQRELQVLQQTGC